MCKDQYLKHLRREIKDLPELEQKRYSPISAKYSKWAALKEKAMNKSPAI